MFFQEYFKPAIFHHFCMADLFSCFRAPKNLVVVWENSDSHLGLCQHIKSTHRVSLDLYINNSFHFINKMLLTSHFISVTSIQTFSVFLTQTFTNSVSQLKFSRKYCTKFQIKITFPSQFPWTLKGCTLKHQHRNLQEHHLWEWTPLWD